ncbi:hypothetical protein LCL89_15540 [Halobacillus yeomjeoni]|uniref:Uncharacterized protein n=1 Tax=Halobacillus yeomjeoni TaxID=311194 RepID=A0A931MV19_9BACI|nr:hypothetical protein [Halobacillus yeomjeoni]MBH0230563.1 hypothetical protein [Halobacillus yeomjeoni]MCA0985448.1 hypothetical protein [Halobacillus yeomjeoni]
MKTHPFNLIFGIIVILSVGVWLYTNFGLIQSEHLSEATITEKTHDEDGYYIKIDKKKLKVKDTSTWMLLETGEHYSVTYEWYGMKKPYVKEINQSHDKDQIGGH